MSMHSVGVTDQYAVYYQAALKEAAQAGGAIMTKVLATARQALRERISQARGFAERDHAELTLTLLDSHAQMLSERYPQVLTDAFAQTKSAGKAPEWDRAAALQGMHLDQLELMDSAQVHESVSLARSQQSVMLAADAALAELNTYICTTLGLDKVHPESNPMRPDVFVRALQSLIAQTQVPSLVRMDWLQHMSAALGDELSILYKTLSRQLHGKGVTAAGYAVIRTHDGGGPRAGSSNVEQTRDHEESVLTLDRLRKLLVGELDMAATGTGVASFAAQFSRQFESGREAAPEPDFEATVPAAFEALQEMKQVDRMMERIGNRRQVARPHLAGGSGSLQDVREHLRRGSSGLGQALSLEVVALMVENIARDVRLLEPIREVIKNLEPALLRLALVDPRFFSDKQHPARRLLQEITHRSLAYERVETRGFSRFMEPLQRALIPLNNLQIENTEPFESVLAALIHEWDERKKPQQLEKAVQALQHAEERNLLAVKIAREIAARPDTQQMPSGLLDFLCGPWSQVVAHARLQDATGAGDPGHYLELVAAIVWSAQPELTSKNIEKLTRLVPKLLAKLREGLHLIDYPPLKTSAFFELLMKLHQQAFRPQSVANVPRLPEVLQPSLQVSEDLWIAPSEAQASGFMEMHEDKPAVAAPSLAQEVNASVTEADRLATAMEKTRVMDPEFSLPVGSWVELLVNDVWVRTQLSWASPHGTLFLFTSTYGNTQSMTRRLRDKLLAAGTLRVVSAQTVVDGALDAVVQTAMLNSLEIKL